MLAAWRGDLAGSRHKRAFNWARSSWMNTDTLEQTTERHVLGTVAGKVSSIFLKSLLKSIKSNGFWVA